jgi:hypothetical protein
MPPVNIHSLGPTQSSHTPTLHIASLPLSPSPSLLHFIENIRQSYEGFDKKQFSPSSSFILSLEPVSQQILGPFSHGWIVQCTVKGSEGVPALLESNLVTE